MRAADRRRSQTRSRTWAAIGCLVATMPRLAVTAERRDRNQVMSESLLRHRPGGLPCACGEASAHRQGRQVTAFQQAKTLRSAPIDRRGALEPARSAAERLPVAASNESTI